MKRTAVFVVKDKSGTGSLLMVEFDSTRSPQSFADRINERPGVQRSIELLGMDELLPDFLNSFPESHRAGTLEEAQSIALKGTWR
jgi:hypothetical protein